ncbi:MAG: hypothetical protein E7560_03625 [Ruminococcaceae bacterium]|nr:hypothetical protein [Oscillospiraceae bacterium]
MKIKNSLLRIVTIVLAMLLLVSCGANEVAVTNVKAYNLPEAIRSVKSGVVAENDAIELSWDIEKSCVIIKNKQTGAVWSTIPYEFYQSGEKPNGSYAANGLLSALKVKYTDRKKYIEADLNSNADATYVMASKVKNGIRVTYYFDKVQISIPIIYALEDDGFTCYIDSANIGESDRNRVTKVSLLPMMASAKNDANNYIFVPSGSGSLMYTDEGGRATRFYSEEVYGDDMGNRGTTMITETQTTRLPVFGVKNGNNGLLGIITSGAETAEIEASVGEERYGYSGVYATFNIRGKASLNIKDINGTAATSTIYSEQKAAVTPAVRYVLLSPEKSDYNGMAEYYRSYLVSKGMKENVGVVDAMVTMLGGVEVRRLALGVPYYTLSEVTTLEDAKNILADFSEKTGGKIAVNLKGFGNSGLSNGKYAGGFSVSNKLGGKKALTSLLDWCKEADIDAFYNFETILFNKNYKNYKTSEAAKTPNDVRSKYTEYTIVTRKNEASSAYMVNRYALATSTDDWLDAAEKLGLSGIGFASLTDIAYGDYEKPEYFCKAHMADDVVGILDAVSKKGIKTFGEGGNAYAAAKLDYVFGAPTEDSAFFELDETIPFYQMVFRGSTSLSGEVINTSDNSKTEFLDSVLTGSSLAFIFANDAEIQVLKTEGLSAIGSSIYSGISDDAVEYVKAAQPLYKALGGASIKTYERNGDIAKTTFSNGVTVIANYSDKAVVTELGSVEAKSFTFSSGKAGN